MSQSINSWHNTIQRAILLFTLYQKRRLKIEQSRVAQRHKMPQGLSRFHRLYWGPHRGGLKCGCTQLHRYKRLHVFCLRSISGHRFRISSLMFKVIYRAGTRECLLVTFGNCPLKNQKLFQVFCDLCFCKRLIFHRLKTFLSC